MKIYYLFIIILVVFFKTGNVLSNDNIFNVNNIELIKKGNENNIGLTNTAIKKGFNKLAEKLLLDTDKKRLKKLNLSQIKQLVSYYRVENKTEGSIDSNRLIFNISFDKDKLHNLFYRLGISYSNIMNEEFFILPILKKNNQLFVYNKNFFFENWNNFDENELIEFILPIEKIETIQNINFNKENLLGLKLDDLFEEYSNKNLALILVEDTRSEEEKVFIKLRIFGKNIIKKINIERLNLNEDQFYKKIIYEVKKELINTAKSQNLIDIRTPAFLNSKLTLNTNNNLVELNKRLKKIDLVENVFVQEFNNNYVYLKIKYLGKLDNIIKQLSEQKIILRLIEDEWRLNII